MEYQYYQGYLLDDIQSWELTEEDTQFLDLCICIIQYKWTIRQAARNSCWSRSTVHKWIHNKLPKLSNECYQCCKRVLRENSTRKVGGVNYGRR